MVFFCLPCSFIIYQMIYIVNKNIYQMLHKFKPERLCNMSIDIYTN